MIWRCDLSLQYAAYREEILAAVQGVLETGVYTLGPEVRRFEEEFAQSLNVPHCVTVANGTDGLTLSLMAMGIGPGDEVITTPFTAIPTVSAIIDAGARPVFADVDPETYLLDQESVLAALSPRTKAVMPVHIFGNVFDVPRLREQLPAGVAVIEDACQAHGSSLRGARAGTMGDSGVFSFYPTKNLGGYGDGGAIVTASGELTARLRRLRMYGMVDKDHIDTTGVNSRLDEVQAAILRVKLKHLEAMNDQRRVVAERYKEFLPSREFTFQQVPEQAICNYHVFAAKVRRDRDGLMRFLEEKDIQTNIYYPLPLTLQKGLAHLGYHLGDFPVAEEICRRIVALPMYPEFPASQQQCVINAIRAYYQTGLAQTEECLPQLEATIQ
ncbi:MAG: DegT/DnrJ/EryC1/StrS family aminotransferase [Verrucomicrobia bacterium]|nr:DegT/DnrJ/EryC1/StrS family aminotransferase [Verrucomicrobiota bacterium]